MIAGIVALLAIGLAACGDGDDPASTTTAASPKGDQGQTNGKSTGGDSAGKSQQDGKGSKPGSDDETSNGSEDSGNLGNFVPKQHKDSGGGSEQFRVKGGDNSVQEFGEEADSSELDEAATALHNFLDARAVGDWTAACTYLDSGTIESLKQLAAQSDALSGASCGEILGKLTNQAALPELRKEAERADVGSLRIEDGRAFIIYRGLEDAIVGIPMANEDGSWKVAGLGGTPLN